MGHPAKPLRFDQVRVLVEGPAGMVRRPEDRRPFTVAPGALRAVWRVPGAARADAGPPGAASRETDDDVDEGQGTAAADGPSASCDADAGLSPFAPPVPRDDDDGRPSSDPDLPPSDGPRGADPEVGWQAGASPARDRRRAAARVEAVTRSVDGARTVHALVALVEETCGGEDRRRTGPWEFTMSLRPVGLGESTLRLRLSPELLSLRFNSDVPATAALLSRHRASLHRQLRERLDPALEIEILLDDA